MMVFYTFALSDNGLTRLLGCAVCQEITRPTRRWLTRRRRTSTPATATRPAGTSDRVSFPPTRISPGEFPANPHQTG